MWTAVGVDSKQLRASQGGAREAGGSTSAGCPRGLSLPRGGKLGMQPCPSPIRVIPHPDFALPSLRAMPLSSPLPPKLIPPSPALSLARRGVLPTSPPACALERKSCLFHTP